MLTKFAGGRGYYDKRRAASDHHNAALRPPVAGIVESLVADLAILDVVRTAGSDGYRCGAGECANALTSSNRVGSFPISATMRAASIGTSPGRSAGSALAGGCRVGRCGSLRRPHWVFVGFNRDRRVFDAAAVFCNHASKALNPVAPVSIRARATSAPSSSTNAMS